MGGLKEGADMESNGTALVVGAGITGVAAAEWLRRDGWRVTLIDRVDPGDPAQASYGNGGILARCAVVPVSVPGLLAKAPRMLLDPGSPLFLRWSYLPRLLPWLAPFLRSGREDEVRRIAAALAALTSDSVDQHQALAAGTGAERFIGVDEYAYLYRDRAAFEADAWGFALRRTLGFDWEERGRDALVERDPALSPAYGFGAVFRDHGWITSPGGYVAALAESFRREGGVFRRAEVADVSPDGAVTLEGGETLSADRVILAAGVWSRRLAERLGHRVVMETERGYHLMLRGTSARPPFPYMIADAKFVATPMEDGFRCAGIVELGGLDAPPSEAPRRLLRRRIAEVYPGLTWEAEEDWLGHRPSTCDSLPLLGAAPRAPKVVFAFGSQHVGLTIGPRLGRMAAAIASGRGTNIDLAPYAPDRFDRAAAPAA